MWSAEMSLEEAKGVQLLLVQKLSVPDAVWAVTKIIQKETDVESDKVHG